MNAIRALLRQRQALNSALRQFLTKADYLEAETPTLAPSLIPESYLEVFATQLTSPSLDHPHQAYLLASPEAFLKRLLSLGAGNIFFLGKAFRNGEPIGQNHNHEFTILEWYKIGYTYFELIKEIEQMISFVAKQLDTDIGVNLDSPWEYLTIKEAYSRYAEGEKLLPETFEKVYVKYLEPNLGTRGRPTFIYDFPAWQSPLAKEVNGLAQRFELYINGTELINGWTELTDWRTQEQNLVTENLEREKHGRSPIVMDKGFIESLKQGIPECAGAAMGVDRLLMLLGGFKTIQEVIPFSTRNLF